jgi:DNA-binding HxlR family transcriptional regulator
MAVTLTSKYFEILSHPIRFAILQNLNFKMRNFGEILQAVDFNEETGSSKLNFHLKKLIDFEIVSKEDKSYFLTELGFKLLALIQNFQDINSSEPNQANNHKMSEVISEDFSESDKNEEINSKNNELPIIKRPDLLPAIVSVFEYFEGKNYDFMEKNYSLYLPEPISTEINPRIWIQNFSKSIFPLLNKEKSKEWLIDRYLKLGYGTRGLQDFGLMDASISVPPLSILFGTLIELLQMRGKAGLYGKTGMGKSRIALYIASYWIRRFKTHILYMQNPNYLSENDFQKLEGFLVEKNVTNRNDPRILVIIEDAHLINARQLENLKKIIAGANNKTYSIFVSFTDIQVINDTNKILNSNTRLIEDLKQELIPLEYAEILDLNNHWQTLRPYFREWLQWVATDILFDILPSIPKKEDHENTEKYYSPWSFVVSLGFLENSLKELQKLSTSNNLPLILYYSLAQIYIMRGERNINLDNLIHMIETNFKQELIQLIGNEWESQIINQLNAWTMPNSRLLPPFKHSQNNRTFSKETQIAFYHIKWAYKVCETLDTNHKSDEINFNEFFIHIFPTLFEIWKHIVQNDKNVDHFLFWLRETTKFDINSNGEIRITSFRPNSSHHKILQSFSITDNKLNIFKPSEMINWLFIKSVVNN